MAVCNIITLFFLYYISYGLVTLLKFTGATIQVSDILVLTVSFKLLNFSLQIFLLFISEMSASCTSYIV